MAEKFIEAFYHIDVLRAESLQTAQLDKLYVLGSTIMKDYRVEWRISNYVKYFTGQMTLKCPNAILWNSQKNSSDGLQLLQNSAACKITKLLLCEGHWKVPFTLRRFLWFPKYIKSKLFFWTPECLLNPSSKNVIRSIEI